MIMNAIKITLITIATFVLIIGAGYLYASNGIKSKPGYVDLIVPSDESVRSLLSVNLGPDGVQPVRWLLEKIADESNHSVELPEQVLKTAFQELQGVQLRVYEVGANRRDFDAAIAESVVALKAKSWQTLARVREDDVKVEVLQYTAAGKIAGLSIMASTRDKALFLNLIGNFDVDAIADAITQSG